MSYIPVNSILNNITQADLARNLGVLNEVYLLELPRNGLKISIEPPEMRRKILNEYLQQCEDSSLEVDIFIVQIRWLIGTGHEYELKKGRGKEQGQVQITINEEFLNEAEKMLKELIKLKGINIGVNIHYKPVYEYFQKHNLIAIRFLRQATENSYLENSNLGVEATTLTRELKEKIEEVASEKKSESGVRDCVINSLKFILINCSTQAKEILLLSKPNEYKRYLDVEVPM